MHDLVPIGCFAVVAIWLMVFTCLLLWMEGIYRDYIIWF